VHDLLLDIRYALMGVALFRPGRRQGTGRHGPTGDDAGGNGIFGMAAYNVSRRMKELGIRVALGARTKHVMTAAVGRPIVLLMIGSMTGLLLCVFASRLLGANSLSAKSARSRSRRRRGADDGVAGRCSVGNSSHASAWRGSLQTFAGRVKQLSALRLVATWEDPEDPVIIPASCCWRA
jgi:hypothetical protein